MAYIAAVTAFIIAVLSTTMNTVLYVTQHEAISLGAAIFCGFFALFDLVMIRQIRA